MDTLQRTLVLSGIKHCGKSTLGAALARRYGVPFLDTDSELENAFFMKSGERLSTREIFRRLGEDGFRRFEAEVVASLARSGAEVRVIALGGGVPANPFLARDVLRELGFTVYLEIRFELAFERVLRNGLPPFLAGAADPFAEFCRLNRARERAYLECADLVFPIDRELPADENARLLVARIEQEFDGK